MVKISKEERARRLVNERIKAGTEIRNAKEAYEKCKEKEEKRILKAEKRLKKVNEGKLPTKRPKKGGPVPPPKPKKTPVPPPKPKKRTATQAQLEALARGRATAARNRAARK